MARGSGPWPSVHCFVARGSGGPGRAAAASPRVDVRTNLFSLSMRYTALRFMRIPSPSEAMPRAADSQTSDAVRSSAEAARLEFRPAAAEPSRWPHAPATERGKISEPYKLCASIRRATPSPLVRRPRRRRAQPGRRLQNLEIHGQFADLALEAVELFFAQRFIFLGPRDAWPSSVELLLASARLPFAHLTVSRTLYYWRLDSQGEQDMAALLSPS